MNDAEDPRDQIDEDDDEIRDLRSWGTDALQALSDAFDKVVRAREAEPGISHTDPETAEWFDLGYLNPSAPGRFPGIGGAAPTPDAISDELQVKRSVRFFSIPDNGPKWHAYFSYGLSVCGEHTYDAAYPDGCKSDDTERGYGIPSRFCDDCVRRAVTGTAPLKGLWGSQQG